MKLYQIVYFQQVCKNGFNISKASEVLHVSQPSISNAIKDLESKFGIALFNRVNNRLVITEAGEHFLGLIDSLLEQAESIETEMKCLSHLELPLRIGVSPMDFSSVFELIFEKFSKAYPNIKLEIQEAGDMLTKVKEEHIDVAFIAGNGLDLKSFNTQLIKYSRVMLYVSKHHPLASKSSVTLNELAGLDMVLVDSMRLKTFIHKNELEFQTITYTNQLSTMLQMVRSNKACSILLEDVSTSDLIKCIPLEGIPKINIEMIWKKNKVHKTPLKVLISFINETLNLIE